MRLDFDGDELQTAVVAVASALPAAVAHPYRCPMRRLTHMLHHRSLTVACLALLYGLFPLAYVVGASHQMHEQDVGFLLLASITALLGWIICAATLIVLLKDSRTGYPSFRCSVATLLWSFACVPVLFLTVGIARGLMR